ncbi:hypothetical protein G9A89_001518 [Geosiphon pyriformis]|nr:hypothetical protein G9A89_001518 [Geosiphon pyriformis]
MVKKTKSSEKWEQSLASAIVILNLFVVPNEILNEISIILSSILFKISLDQPLAVLPNMVSSDRLSPVLEVKQFPSVGSPVLGNWADQMETKSSLFLVSGAISGVHGFLGAKSVSKNNVKLFCVEFASQMSLDTVFLVELTSSIHLATLKIAKSLHDVPLGVSAADIKTAFSVFGNITHVVLKFAGVWQYVVVYFKKLDSANSVRILPLVNQNETILSHNKFKTKLVNLSSECTAFEISDMISQVGCQTCFIPYSLEFGCCFQFALVTFGSQADLDSVVVKTKLGYLAADCKVSLSSSPKFPKVFTPHFVGLKFYAKASAPLDFSGFPPLLSLVSSPVVVGDPLVLFQLSSLESDLTKLSVLVKSIVKSIGFLVTIFEQFINSDLVLSSVLGLRINEVLVHMGFFSRTVSKLGRKVVSLKKECCIKDIDMSDNLELPPVVNDEVFSNLMSLWEHKSVDVKTNPFKTAEWLIGLVSCSATLFSVIQKMSSLDKFSSVVLA